MAQTFNISVPDELMPLLDWALADAQSKLGDTAPTTRTALLREAFQTFIVPMWKAQHARATVVDLQTTLNDTSEEEKSTVVQALTVLKTMTPEQRLEALQAIINMAPVE
jgi:hypothetical protein